MEIDYGQVKNLLEYYSANFHYGYPTCEEKGELSCRGFVRRLYAEMGIVLPPRYLSYEVFTCKDGLFMEAGYPYKPMDIFCLGCPDRPRFEYYIHLAIYLGLDVPGTEEPIIHEFSRVENGYSKGQLSTIVARDNCELVGVRRLDPNV